MATFEQTLLKDLLQNEHEWPGAYQRIDGVRCFAKAFRLPWQQKIFAGIRMRVMVWRSQIERTMSRNLRPLPMYRIKQRNAELAL